MRSTLFIILTLIHLSISFEAPLPPILLVPGLGGSKLYDRDNDKIWVVYNNAGYGVRCISNPECDIYTRWTNYGLSEVDQLNPDLIIGTDRTNYYKGLIDNLKGYGYVPGKNLFAFPYEWRTGLTNFKVLIDLHYLISYIKPVVITHSMGGLLLQEYVTKHPNNNIRKIINVCVPFQGTGGNVLKAFVDGYDLGNSLVSSYKTELRNVALKFTSAYHLLPKGHTYTYVGLEAPKINGADYYNVLSSVSGFNRSYYDQVRNIRRDHNLITPSYYITMSSTQQTTYWDYGGVTPKTLPGDGSVPLFSQTPLFTPEDRITLLSGTADHVTVLETPNLVKKVMDFVGNCDFTGKFCEQSKPNCICINPTLNRNRYNITNCNGYTVAQDVAWYSCRKIIVNNIEYLRIIGNECSGHHIYNSRYSRGYYYYTYCHYGKFSERVYRVCYNNETQYDPILEKCGNSTTIGIDPSDLDISSEDLAEFTRTYVDPELPMKILYINVTSEIVRYINVTSDGDYDQVLQSLKSIDNWRIATIVLIFITTILLTALLSIGAVFIRNRLKDNNSYKIVYVEDAL